MTPEQLNAIIDERVKIVTAGGTKAWLLGAVKSVTVWWTSILGGIIAAWPEIRALLEESVFPMMSEEAKSRWARIFGATVAIVGIIIRHLTTQSLTEKGTK